MSRGGSALLRRADAYDGQWAILGVNCDAARRAAFSQQCRSVPVGPAIGGDENLVVAALNRAVAVQACRAHHAHARTGRSLLALRPRHTARALRAGWTGRSCRTGIALRTLRSGRALIAFGALAAA